MTFAELVVAFGLVLVIEGILYALFPNALRRMLAVVLTQPELTIRLTGVAAATAGLVVVLLARG